VLLSERSSSEPGSSLLSSRSSSASLPLSESSEPPPRRWRGRLKQGTGRLSLEEGRDKRVVFGAILVDGLFSFRCVWAMVLWIEIRLLKEGKIKWGAGFSKINL
jgi:hypothetical protein